MSDEDTEGIVGCLFLILIPIGLAVWLLLWNITTPHHIVIDSGKHWVSYAKWTEDYETWECDTDSNGERECGWETETRTICSDSKIGYELPVSYPELSCVGEDYHESVRFYIVYHEEDSQETITSWTSFEIWNIVHVGESHEIDRNLLGYVKTLK